MLLIVTCSYYNTGGNYATIEDRTTTDDSSDRLIIRWTPDNYIWYFWWCAYYSTVPTKNVWWGNQGILGVGNNTVVGNSTVGTRHDNILCLSYSQLH